MNSKISKRFTLLIALFIICSMFTSCGIFVGSKPFLLPYMPAADISFIPEDITLPQSTIDTYSYTPKVYGSMPIIHINTKDGSNSFATDYILSDKLLNQIEYVDATVSVNGCNSTMLLTDVDASVKVRGNFTLNYDKKPIRIKFDKKQSMLGLHEGEKYKNWVLLADWKDLSLQNNIIAFYLANAILGSDGYYCTDFRNVEVYLNGEYWGVYLLAEQQETKNDRFSIPDVADDYTGTDIGYMFEYDGYYTHENQLPEGSGDPTFIIDHYDMPFNQPGYTIKSDINHPSQLAFLSNYVQNAYAVLYSATQEQQYLGFNRDYNELIANKYDNAKDAISSCIDIQSLVDTYILNEIACDLDIAWSSFYLSLDMNENGSKKLIFEGPWDFDSAFGICHNYSKTEKMYACESLNPWLSLLKDEQWFQDLVTQKWDELKQAGVLDNALALSLYHKTAFADNYTRNYERWSTRITGGNSELVPEINTYTTQSQAADYQYRWLKARFVFLDNLWKMNE